MTTRGILAMMIVVGFVLILASLGATTTGIGMLLMMVGAAAFVATETK